MPWLRSALLRSLTCSCGASGFLTCGKASERIVERELHVDRGKVGAHKGGGRADPRDAGSQWNFSAGVYGHYETRTVGFTDCGHNNWRPGTVLDPFIGSGTTAAVARKHGRRTIGIELNPDYCQLAARRLQQLSLLAEPA